MHTPGPPNITPLLVAWGNGDKHALDELIPLIHTELRRLASRQMRRESPGHLLQTTALVNEAYCKLVNQKNVQWQNRAHFFAIAAQIMRRILVDYAKSSERLKRGGSSPQKISLDDVVLISESKAAEVIAVHYALIRLEKLDPLKARIVELKFFGGLTTEEIAAVEHVSTRTIEREWRKAKAWLYDALFK